MTPPRRTITEVDGRRNPTDPSAESRPRAWDDAEDSPTGARSAERLAAELAQRTRELAEAREALKARPPVEAEPEAELVLRASGKSKQAAGLLLAIATTLGGVAGVGGGIGLNRVEKLAEPPVTHAQLDEIALRVKQLDERISGQSSFLTSQAGDTEELERLLAAFMCSQRRVLAQGLDCDQVLSAVQVNPDPLASKPPPQLVIRGARLPSPRKPPSQ